MSGTLSGDEMAVVLVRQQQAVARWRLHQRTDTPDGKRPSVGQSANGRLSIAHRKILNRNRCGATREGTIFSHGHLLPNSQQDFTLKLTIPALYRN